jgi:hypothetical protein
MSDTSSATPSVVVIKESPPIADPGPLGLAGFALTTFLLSVHNAGWDRGTGLDWLGYAFAYGGVAQLLAGMWEFKNRNVFGATAFSSYGAFWIGLGLWVELAAGHAKSAAQANNDLGWILLGFFIFTTYMWLCSAGTNLVLFSVFTVLDITFLILVIGNFSNSVNTVKFGGILGVITAALAWYASAAGVINGMRGKQVLFMGKPLIKPAQNA